MTHGNIISNLAGAYQHLVSNGSVPTSQLIRRGIPPLVLACSVVALVCYWDTIIMAATILQCVMSNCDLQESMFESSPEDVHISYLPLAHMFERVCMVCVYVCTCVCMYVCVYVCVYVCMYVWLDDCMSTVGTYIECGLTHNYKLATGAYELPQCSW